jgi:hypothetical protein
MSITGPAAVGPNSGTPRPAQACPAMRGGARKSHSGTPFTGHEPGGSTLTTETTQIARIGPSDGSG